MLVSLKKPSVYGQYLFPHFLFVTILLTEV